MDYEEEIKLVYFAFASLFTQRVLFVYIRTLETEKRPSWKRNHYGSVDWMLPSQTFHRFLDSTNF